MGRSIAPTETDGRSFETLASLAPRDEGGDIGQDPDLILSAAEGGVSKDRP